MSIRKMSSKLSQERAEMDSLRVEEARLSRMPSGLALFLAATMAIMVMTGWIAVHRAHRTKPDHACIIGQESVMLVAPQAKIHATPHGSDGSFIASAECPTRWQVYLSQKDREIYSASSHSYSDMINMLAEASCVPAGDQDKKEKR